jgi:hypothetical protein
MIISITVANVNVIDSSSTTTAADAITTPPHQYFTANNQLNIIQHMRMLTLQ